MTTLANWFAPPANPSLAMNRINHLQQNRLGEYPELNSRPGAWYELMPPSLSAASDALIVSDITPSAVVSVAVFTLTFTPASTASPSPLSGKS
ncbi:MAG TPA: hypothetical protein VFV58_09800 [Blastocatellia bacterium]|jgi:hypothetical protein|nr:hypothetical protein [Blastocatellia bacterium]